MIETVLIIILAYGLGSIPFGLVLTQAAGLGDIRSIGSGNIGATNVLRTGRKGIAFFTLLLDGVKGAVAALIAEALVPGTGQAAGMAALLGHLFPVWLRFKGGKGVATSLGVLTALAWPVGVAAMLTWLAVALVLRYSSLAALVSLALAPLTAYALGYQDVVGMAAVIAVLVVIKHKANIQRLVSGIEPRIGESKNKNAAKEPQA